MDQKIVYFEKPGQQNTQKALRLARNRTAELGLKHVVLASTHGYTALHAAEIFQGSGIEQEGVRVLTSLHGLADGAEIAALGGTDQGCDTAVVLRPADVDGTWEPTV